MNPHQIKHSLPLISTSLIGLFFLLILHFKISYTLIPILLALIGLGLLLPKLKPQHWQLNRSDRWLIAAFVSYFLLSLLSMWLHQGRGRELDIPSKLLILLPMLALFSRIRLHTAWILSAIVLATLIAGVVGIVQFSLKQLLFPAHMYIQSGGILMSLSLFCVAIAFYFQQQKKMRWFGISLLACAFGIVACLLNQARGAWLVSPVILLLLLWLNRHLISKWFMLALLAISLVGGLTAGDVVQKRWHEATQEIQLYIEKNNGSTSVGARLDMWKSALLGIEEKPLFGWGVEGVKNLRKMHQQQGKISTFAASFVHAHNQYLHDATVKGLLGLSSLLALFIVPLYFFGKTILTAATDSRSRLWGMLGIVHILSIMGYCLTQSFLAHNSGMMFFAFGTLLFYGLQKNSLDTPLAEAQRC